MSEKYTFQDFLTSVDEENQEYVSELHDTLTKLGCKIDVKAAKSGYVVSYIQNKKTIANYVFRKKGLVDPAACNQKCPMGYDFILKGKRLQKCRSNAFMFLLSEENKPFVKRLLLKEVEEGCDGNPAG